MPSKPLTIHDLRTLINEGNAKDPLVFLESVMNGQDPRRLSSTYELVMEIDAFTNGELSKSDWQELVNHVYENAKYHTVSMNESMTAAKTLAEYLFPKRKQVDLNGTGERTGSASADPLTAEEIELFKEKFNDEF